MLYGTTTSSQKAHLHCSTHPCTWQCCHAGETWGFQFHAQSPVDAQQCCAEVFSQLLLLLCCPAMGHNDTSPHCQSSPNETAERMNDTMAMVCITNQKRARVWWNMVLFCTFPSCCRKIRCRSSNCAGSWFSNAPGNPEHRALIGTMSLSTSSS